MGVIKKHWQLVVAGGILAATLLAILLVAFWSDISPGPSTTPTPTPTTTSHFTPTPTATEPMVSVWIDAPDKVTKGDRFTVTVNISQVSDLDTAQYDIRYDVSVVTVLSIDEGMMGANTVPVDGWNFVPSGEPGTVRVINSAPGTSGISGSGYLAKINCRATGSSNQSGDLEFVEGQATPPGKLLIIAIDEEEIPATWTDGSVEIASLPSDGDGQDSDYAQLPLGIRIAAPKIGRAHV